MLPSFLQSCLWSYDLSQLDPENPRDKKVIIAQVLNHGTWQQLEWLLKTYSKAEIKIVLANPSPGEWQRPVLDYWQKVLDFVIPKDLYQRALFNLNG
ncbi:MAG: hypothetical protein ABII72_04055 [Parcubacteria group bacterium]